MGLFVGTTGSAFGTTISTLDFNQAGVLPSSQGWTYSGNLSEASVYSTSGGLLHMNTEGQGTGNTAEYQLGGGNYDVDMDLSFEFRAQFLDIGSGTSSVQPFFGIGVNDRVGPDGGSIYVYFTDSTILFFNDNTRIAEPLDGLAHTYLLTASGSNHTFQFSIDGNIVKTGTVGPQDNSYLPSVFFGDDSSGTDSAKVDLDYVHYNNGTAVPEPSSLVLMLSAGLGFAIISSIRGRSLTSR